MHPVIIQQLAADRIRELHAKAEEERLARQARRARRRAPSTRPGLPASGTLSYDDPRLDAGQRPAIPEQPSAPPLPAMATRRRIAATPSGDANRWTIAADQSEPAGGLIVMSSSPYAARHRFARRSPVHSG